MLTYETIKKSYDPFKNTDVNLLFGNAIAKRIKQNKMKIQDTTRLVKSIAFDKLAEDFAIYQVHNPKDKITIIVFREFITAKFLGYRIALNNDSEKIVRETSMIPFAYDKLTKAYIPFGKSNGIEIVFCTVNKINSVDLIDFGAYKIAKINKSSNFSDDEGDAYGSMLAELIPALQEIEQEPDLVP